MKKILSLFISSAVLALSGCATQQVSPYKVTSSGLPERVFSGVSLDVLRSRMIEGCYRIKMQVDDTTGTNVLCSKEIDGSEAFLVQLMLGNSYADTPRGNIKFQFLKINEKDIKVIVVPSYSVRMLNGKVNSAQITNQNSLNELQKALERIDFNKK